MSALPDSAPECEAREVTKALTGSVISIKLMIDDTINCPWDEMARQTSITVATIKFDHITHFNVHVRRNCGQCMLTGRVDLSIHAKQSEISRTYFCSCCTNANIPIAAMKTGMRRFNFDMIEVTKNLHPKKRDEIFRAERGFASVLRLHKVSAFVRCSSLLQGGGRPLAICSATAQSITSQASLLSRRPTTDKIIRRFRR